MDLPKRLDVHLTTAFTEALGKNALAIAGGASADAMWKYAVKAAQNSHCPVTNRHYGCVLFSGQREFNIYESGVIESRFGTTITAEDAAVAKLVHWTNGTARIRSVMCVAYQGSDYRQAQVVIPSASRMAMIREFVGEKAFVYGVDEVGGIKHLVPQLIE